MTPIVVPTQGENKIVRSVMNKPETTPYNWYYLKNNAFLTILTQKSPQYMVGPPDTLGDNITYTGVLLTTSHPSYNIIFCYKQSRYSTNPGVTFMERLSQLLGW